MTTDLDDIPNMLLPLGLTMTITITDGQAQVEIESKGEPVSVVGRASVSAAISVALERALSRLDSPSGSYGDHRSPGVAFWEGSDLSTVI